MTDSATWTRTSDDAQEHQNGLNLAWFCCDEPGPHVRLDHEGRRVRLEGKVPLQARHVGSLKDDGFPECCDFPMRMLSLSEEIRAPYAKEIQNRNDRGAISRGKRRGSARGIPDKMGDEPDGEFADHAP